jgi:hypothetical protein
MATDSEEIKVKRNAILDQLLRHGITDEKCITEIFDRILEYCHAISEAAIHDAIRNYEDDLFKRAQTGKAVM